MFSPVQAGIRVPLVSPTIISNNPEHPFSYFPVFLSVLLEIFLDKQVLRGLAYGSRGAVFHIRPFVSLFICPHRVLDVTHTNQNDFFIFLYKT